MKIFLFLFFIAFPLFAQYETDYDKLINQPTDIAERYINIAVGNNSYQCISEECENCKECVLKNNTDYESYLKCRRTRMPPYLCWQISFEYKGKANDCKSWSENCFTFCREARKNSRTLNSKTLTYCSNYCYE